MKMVQQEPKHYDYVDNNTCILLYTYVWLVQLQLQLLGHSEFRVICLPLHISSNTRCTFYIPRNSTMPKHRSMIGFRLRYFQILNTDVEMCLTTLVSETGRLYSFDVPPVSTYACF
jgi:hypothetical protein